MNGNTFLKVIAIDGPAGSGKSTVAKMVAEKMNMRYLDTGAMYRVVTFYLIKMGFFEGGAIDIHSALIGIKLNFENDRIFLNGKDVSEEIRTPMVDTKVSYVAKQEEVRAFLTRMQREIAERGNVVIEGRDIGTVVVPEAPLKIFLTASIKERARRRVAQLRSKGIEVDIEKMKREIRKRDEIDSSRSLAPLVKSKDAIEIDTTTLSIEEVVDKIVRLAKKRFKEHGRDVG